MKPTIKNSTEYNVLSEVEDILDDLTIRLRYSINKETVNLKKGLIEDLEKLQLTIYEKRKEYQQEKLTNLKTA